MSPEESCAFKLVSGAILDALASIAILSPEKDIIERSRTGHIIGTHIGNLGRRRFITVAIRNLVEYGTDYNIQCIGADELVHPILEDIPSSASGIEIVVFLRRNIGEIINLRECLGYLIPFRSPKHMTSVIV